MLLVSNPPGASQYVRRHLCSTRWPWYALVMTKTHFEAIAHIIAARAAGNRALVAQTSNDKVYDAAFITALSIVAVDLAEYFEAENPQFNRQKFLAACGL